MAPLPLVTFETQEQPLSAWPALGALYWEPPPFTLPAAPLPWYLFHATHPDVAPCHSSVLKKEKDALQVSFGSLWGIG